MVLVGLKNSKCFVPLISSAALTYVRDFSRDHSHDDMLLEFETSLKVTRARTLCFTTSLACGYFH